MVQRRQYALVTSSSRPLQPRRRPLADWGALRLLRADRGRDRGALSRRSSSTPWSCAGRTTSPPRSSTIASTRWAGTRRSGTACTWRRGRPWSAPCSPSWAPTWSRSAGRRASGPLYLLSILPVSIPGMVLGLAYIFTFNAPGSVLNLPLRHARHPRHLERDPLLHGGLPHRDHRAQADGRGVRERLRVARACRSTGRSGG